MKVDKLTDNNFHAWKLKNELLLAFQELDDVIEDDMPESDDLNFNAWRGRDKKAQVCIGLTLSDSMLENVRECKSAKEMWKTTCDVFEKHTFLSKFAGLRRFLLLNA